MKKLLFDFIIFFCAITAVSGQSLDPAVSTIQRSEVFNDPPFWRQAMGGAVIGPPASQAESVVAVSDGGNVKAYSRQGTFLWDYYARGRLQPYITLSREGTTYVCRSSNQNSGLLIAINRAGRELWQINLGEPLSAPVMTGWDGRLFIFTAQKIRCHTASGYPLWSLNLEKRIALKPRADDAGGFCLALEDGEFLRVNAFGKVISDKLSAVPASVVPVRMSGQRASLLVVNSTGTLELCDTAENSRIALTEITLPARPVSAAGWGDRAAFLLASGRICCVSLTDRKVLWTGETHLTTADVSGAGFDSNLFFDERGIYLMTRNGACAFADDGRRLWLITLRGTASLPVFSDDGLLYSGGADWILYAYKLEERVRVQSRLLYGPAPVGTYGTGIRRPELWSGSPDRYSESHINARFETIQEAVRLGQIGVNETEYASWLMDIAGSSLGIHPQVKPPVIITQRVQAIRLLSYMGSVETVPFLADLFYREREPAAKTAAAEALGRIGVDPEGIALRTFTFSIFPPSPLRDEQALAAVAAATGAICRFSGPPLSEPGIQLLTALAAGDRPPAVRNRAEREIVSLRY